MCFVFTYTFNILFVQFKECLVEIKTFYVIHFLFVGYRLRHQRHFKSIDLALLYKIQTIPTLVAVCCD